MCIHREMCTLEIEHHLNPTIDSALERVRSESSNTPSVLITTAHGKFFSNGYDLAWRGAKTSGPTAATKDRLQLMYYKFRSVISDLISLPMPTNAAGFILAVCHDYVLMRNDRGFLYISDSDLVHGCDTAQDRLAEAATERGIIESAHDSAEETVMFSDALSAVAIDDTVKDIRVT